MKRFSIAIICAVFGSTVSAIADPTLECSSESSQVEIGGCVSAQLDAVTMAMEAALSFARDSAAELDKITERDVAVPALDAAQDAWAAYLETECAFQASLFGGGSGAGIAETACRVTVTRSRVDALLASVR